MQQNSSRRQILARLAALGSVGAALQADAQPAHKVTRQPGTHLKIGLNAYSFNRPLMAGQMTLADVIDFCAEQKIDGVDLTGYYFPGYPKPPKDSFLYELKRRAFLNGVTISGSGVRNDFSLPGAAERKAQVQLVKDWVDVTAELGGSMLRVFSGKEMPKGLNFDQVLQWMLPAFEECCQYGSERGVMIGLQHHDDVLKTAAETIQVVEAVRSPWLGVILDVGSLRQGDPYLEIERLLPYASNWQIKEHVWYGKEKVAIDLKRLRQIIDKVQYRGFTPIEALGDGDAREVVKAFLLRVRQAFA